MNRTEQIFLQAIQKSLWNAEIVLPADTDWDAVLQEAEDQTVLGLVIAAAPKEKQLEWKSRSGIVMASFIRILHYQEQLCTLLEANGIPLVILKGTAAAIYYAKPEQRSMGDIDYLIPLEHFDRAKAILAQNGFTIEEDPRSLRHITVYKDGITFEQHRRFSSDGIEIEKYILEGMQHPETGTIYGHSFPMLPKLANGLVLLGHMVQHLKSGLGLRQIIDWMMYVNRELTDDFWTQTFAPAVKEVGLLKVAVVATAMCKKYLGLPADIHWCDDAEEDLCLDLLETLLSSGNFNRKRGEDSAVETVTTRFANEGLFQFLQIAGEYNWKAYHRHKWLRPFAWAYQIGRYIRQGVQAGRSKSQLADDFHRGNKRAELLKRLGVGR